MAVLPFGKFLRQMPKESQRFSIEIVLQYSYPASKEKLDDFIFFIVPLQHVKVKWQFALNRRSQLFSSNTGNKCLSSGSQIYHRYTGYNDLTLLSCCLSQLTSTSPGESSLINENR